MILVFELTWTGVVHAPGNGATIQAIAGGFPDQEIRVLADAAHIAELRGDPALASRGNVRFRPIEVSPLFPGRTHVVSARRFLHEFAVIRAALRDVPPREACLVMLISATPTAIFAAALLARLSRRRVGVQVGLHGNLNEITGWRPRNPLTRRFDLASAVSARHVPLLRFLVLEQVIKDELERLSPLGAARTDVLPHPVNVAEIPESAGQGLGLPLRIGFVGQATQAKGFDVFLAIARELKARHGDRIAFHLIGRAVPGTDLGNLDVLADPPSAAHLPRAEFTARLATIHYVLLPFRNGYYSLSASGGLIDAITWLKPVITTDVPLARYLFDQFGEIGFLCDDEDGLRRTVETVLAGMDQARYDRQVEALRRVRESRRPAALASAYRTIVDDGFAGLLD